MELLLKNKNRRAEKNNGPNKLLIKTHFPAIAFVRSRVSRTKEKDQRQLCGCRKCTCVRATFAMTSFEANLIPRFFFLSTTFCRRHTFRNRVHRRTIYYAHRQHQLYQITHKYTYLLTAKMNKDSVPEKKQWESQKKVDNEKTTAMMTAVAREMRRWERLNVSLRWLVPVFHIFLSAPFLFNFTAAVVAATAARHANTFFWILN